MKLNFKTKLKKTIATIFSLLAITELPVKEGKLNFSADQKKKLEDAIGPDLYKSMVSQIEKELSEANKDKEAELEAAKAEILAVMEAGGFSEEEKEEVLNAESTDELQVSDKLKAMSEQYIKLKEEMDAQQKTIEELLKSAEDDIGEEIDMKNNLMNHSKTHLFGSTFEYDAFENRPWNQRLRDGSKKATTFNDTDLPVLAGDAQHFIRTNPGVIASLFDDFEELPSGWTAITGVEDQYAGASVVTSEILQGRSKGWNPKGKIKIAVEQMKVYAKKIDKTFDGQQLQTLENTWIAKVKDLDGSHPWKMSFIFWVLSELVKQLKLDERKSMVNGIYAPIADGDGEDLAGPAVNSQNGLRWWLWYHINITKKIVPFNVGKPEVGGMVDYVKTMIERIPETERNAEGLVFNLSDKWFKVYQDEAGQKYTHLFTTDQGKLRYQLSHVVDYPNVRFQVLRDYTNTDHMYITKEANHTKLDYKPEEKGLLTVTHEKRDTHIFGDYKTGFGFQLVGVKAKDGEPRDFNRQLIYTNNLPVFDDSVSAPFYSANDGVLKVNYQHMKAHETFNSDITSIEPMNEDLPFLMDFKGNILKITGNTNMASAKNVKNGNNIVLASGADFNLQSGGTLTLYCRPSDGKFVELSRTNTPAVEPDAGTIMFDDVVIDASEGDTFIFEGSDATTLATILNGVPQQVITIKAESGADALTITGDDINVGANAVIDDATKEIKLMYLDGVWYEIERNF